MKFGHVALKDAEGAILAHTLKLAGAGLRKGRILSSDDLATLRKAGVDEIIGARLEPGDLHEDEAARRVAGAVAGDGLVIGAAFTGRCNLYAAAPGLVIYEPSRLDAVNLVNEAITVATLPPDQPVSRRQTVATVKIIPYGVGETLVSRAEDAAAMAAPLVRVAAFRPMSAGLVQTELPGTKTHVLDKTRAVVAARLQACGSRLVEERRCAHEPGAIAQALSTLVSRGCELLLIASASATTDRRDVLPLGIEEAGGTVDQLGMPVDPGNLLIVGRLAAELPVLGLPGCARSPAANGFDLALHRLLAGLPLTATDIRRMGAGGLLKGVPGYRSFRTDIGAPAAESADEGAAMYPSAPAIAAVVLAAGRSRRMGGVNKLLMPIEGEAMVRRVVRQVRASQAEPVVVVVGHQAQDVKAKLADQDVKIVDNPDFADGLSTSLRCGLATLPAEAAGVVVCLGDMPWVGAADVNRLIAAFSEEDGRLICVPTRHGRRGNPVLWSRRFFGEIKRLAGDAGARDLIERYPDLVCEVEMGHDGVLEDIDMPRQWPSPVAAEQQALRRV